MWGFLCGFARWVVVEQNGGVEVGGGGVWEEGGSTGTCYKYEAAKVGCTFISSL